MSRFNLRVPGWDGTPLALDAHLPDERHWPVPVVVTRTPYGRSNHLAEGAGWAGRGFGYVVQDVRGRYDSDGTWECYRNERGDGAALADWITAQPWSDGTLIGYGGSYSGYTAWALAAERPVPVVVSMGPSMALHRTKFDGGVLRLAEHAAWWLERADGRTSRDGLTARIFGERPGLLAHLPVMDLPAALGARLPGWADVIARGPHDLPKEEVTEQELAGLAVAGLHIGGWYDLLVDETLLHWRTVGSALSGRPPQGLVIGPWGHDLAFTGKTRHGDREHGPGSLRDLGALQVDWIRAALAGTAENRTDVFVVGENRWRARPEPTAITTLHAHADGSLRDHEGPGEPGAFTHDPADPYPSAPPATDRAHLEARADALRFTGAPLTGPLTVTAATAELTTGTVRTDWIVRLVEITPSGRHLELAHGCAGDTGSARHRIGLTPLAVTVPAGSRLRLEITASDFPRLARAPGTGADRYTTTRLEPVRQAVRTALIRLETS